MRLPYARSLWGGFLTVASRRRSCLLVNCQRTCEPAKFRKKAKKLACGDIPVGSLRLDHRIPLKKKARLLGERVSGNWEGKAPAEPIPWLKPKWLGRSLALPMASFLVFMGFEFPDTLSRRTRASETQKTPLRTHPFCESDAELAAAGWKDASRDCSLSWRTTSTGSSVSRKISNCRRDQLGPSAMFCV